ncbi:MAG TPA: SAM-dependent methyltransferase [Candidatus Thermoplasmatota archaeon]|nr:SAM-dependent methyltransferase [Candidatus Thermoplasmatota archaeon]
MAGLRDRMASALRGGPVPFSAWMAACLYDEEAGYYTGARRKTGRGRDADFVTPPTLHPFFAHCVARETVARWEARGRPRSWCVLELGGGEGDLARDALAEVDRLAPSLGSCIVWTHSEPSPSHVAAQKRAADPRMRWHLGGGVSPPGQGAGPAAAAKVDQAVLVEVLDAVPCRLLEARGGRWHEVWVGWDDAVARFTKVLRPSLEPPSEPAGADGERLVVADAAQDLLAKVLRASDAVLVADYGGLGPARGVRGFRSHQLVEDVLSSPGEVDITYNVDFQALGALAPPEDGWTVTLETFEAFLLRHGILEELNRTDRTTLEGASSYLRLRQLLLPTGMGHAFRVQRFERTPAAPAVTPAG